MVDGKDRSRRCNPRLIGHDDQPVRAGRSCLNDHRPTIELEHWAIYVAGKTKLAALAKLDRRTISESDQCPPTPRCPQTLAGKHLLARPQKLCPTVCDTINFTFCRLDHSVEETVVFRDTLPDRPGEQTNGQNRRCRKPPPQHLPATRARIQSCRSRQLLVLNCQLPSSVTAVAGLFQCTPARHTLTDMILEEQGSRCGEPSCQIGGNQRLKICTASQVFNWPG